MERRMAPSDEEGKEIVAKGQALYDAQIRIRVETMGNLGRILLLDIDTGEYHITRNDGEDRLAMSRTMREQNPAVRIYGIRIGYPSVSKFAGAKWEPVIGGKPVVRSK